MILVICVDRDDDLGSKANIEGPVIGRTDNINAAIKLGLADPEDSDANTIFEGVRIYDDLKSQEKDVEIASISGSPDIGLKSDQNLSDQLDSVLDKVGMQMRS